MSPRPQSLFREESFSDDSASLDQVDFYQLSNLGPNHRTTLQQIPKSHQVDTEYSPEYNIDEAITYDDRQTELVDRQLYDKNEQTRKEYTRSSRVFLAISIVSALLITLFEAYMFAVINIHKAYVSDLTRFKVVQTYLALFIFASIYQVVLTVIGLRTKNMLLLIFLCLFYVAMLVYTCIQYMEITETIGDVLVGGWKTATRATNMATIGVIAATFAIQILFIVFILNKKVKWSMFKKIGANFKIKQMYLAFQVHRSLLIFDFFFFLAFTIQFAVIMLNKKSTEFILTIVVIPITILVLIVDDISVTREFISGALFAIVVYFCGVAYAVFKTIRLYTTYSHGYFAGRKSLTTFGVLTTVMLLITIIVEIVVVINFNKGLKPFVNTYYSWVPGHGKGYKKFNGGDSATNDSKIENELLID